MAHFCLRIPKLQIGLASVAASCPSFLIDDIIVWHHWHSHKVREPLRISQGSKCHSKHQDQPPRALGRAEDTSSLQGLNVVPTHLTPACTAGAVRQRCSTPSALPRSCLQPAASALVALFQTFCLAQKAQLQTLESVNQGDLALPLKKLCDFGQSLWNRGVRPRLQRLKQEFCSACFDVGKALFCCCCFGSLSNKYSHNCLLSILNPSPNYGGLLLSILFIFVWLIFLKIIFVLSQR